MANGSEANVDANLDNRFTTSDLVDVFQAGQYETAAEPLAAEIAAAVDWLFARDEPTKKARAFIS